ncbi:MAG TPA: hypothetical protein PLP88_09915 [Bacteroidales bacterium]|nr:hypothetical protein [Bacteroidales bacterium]
MPSSNFERLVALANKVFDIKNDPSQLNVNEDVLKRLKSIHPATISEFDNGNGPVAWLLLIPTTIEIMNRFISGTINERELYELTPTGIKYEAIYLCSALVLEEYRRKGIIKTLALNAIKRIQSNHPIKALFVWPFSSEGNKAAEMISTLVSLPLYSRKS